MQTIEKSIGIDAPIEKVYEVLTNPQLVRSWASAFSEGTYAETDWLPGSTGRLDIKAGALPEGDYKAHEPLWDKAIRLIKELAEK